MNVYIKRGYITSPDITIASAIIQRNSFSVLFCLVLFQLSMQLNNTKRGYNIFHLQFNHLINSDELKMFAKSDQGLEVPLNIGKIFSSDIDKKFGLDKCANANSMEGKLIKAKHIELNTTTAIRNLHRSEVYEDLGTYECDVIHDSTNSENPQRMVPMLEKSPKFKLKCL